MKNKQRCLQRATAILLAGLLTVSSVDLSVFTAYASETAVQTDVKETVQETKSTETQDGAENVKNTLLTVVGFAELEETIRNQQFAIGCFEIDIVFPDTLGVTVSVSDAESTKTKDMTLADITWELNPAESDGEVFDSSEACDGYCYVYTPMLPETDEDGNKVTLGEGVEAPVIYVLIGEGEDHVSAIAEDECTEHSIIFSASATDTPTIYLPSTGDWVDTEATATLTDQNGNSLTGDDWWAQSVITFTAPSGVTICKEKYGTYTDSFTFDNDGADTGSEGTSVTYYLKNSSGEIAQITQTVHIDRTAPTFPDEGNYGIKIKDNWFKSLLNTITFNLFYKENVEVTVKAEDALSGIASYYYWVDTSGSTTVLTAEELSTKTFTKTDNAKIATTTQDGKSVYYVYVEDKAGNRSNYICSEGVVVDTAAPEVSVTTGTKDVTATLTVTATDTGSGLEGNYHLYYSTNSLDGMTAEQIIGDSSTQSNATGEFPLTGLDCATTYHYAVVVKDRAGNVALKKDTFTTEKTIPEFDASYIPTISGTYGQSLSDMTLSKATDTSNNSIAGTWEITEANAGSIYPTVNGTKKYEVTFIPTDGSKFAPYTEQTTVSVMKATPYIETVPSANAITYGQMLSSSSLTNGKVQYSASNDQTVAGSFVWKDANIKPTAKDDSNNTRYTVIFKPTDSDNYNEVETEITITVNKAQNAPNMPGSIMSVANSITKVGDVTLPSGWVWDESDKDTPLEVDVEESATALYEGADKGNYENESVNITITRSACEHVPGEILYTGTGEHAPDCVNDGLGHKECTKCHAVTESSFVVEALGHQGGIATCKKKAVCMVCHQEYGSTNPAVHAVTEVKGHKSAACTSAGYTGDTYCKDCENKIKDGTIITAFGHNYKSEETKEPTTTSTGVRTYTCERCGHSYTETIAKLPEETHNHSYTEKITSQPDCTNAGVRNYSCSCGDSYTENIPALEHHYISKVTKEATTTAEGIMTYTCDRCGYSYTKSIEQLSGDGQQGNSDKSNNQQIVGILQWINNLANANKPASNNQTGNTVKPSNSNPQVSSGKPYIEGKSDQNGWENIKEQLKETTTSVTVAMNGTSVVPGTVLDTIKGKDVSVVFNMGEGITWAINGKDITADQVGDIDFGVTVGAQAGNTIPVDIINNVTGERQSVNVSLAYDGEFGFRAILTVNAGKENAGLFANLFYYNPESGALEYICASQIDVDGNANLEFTHASDYVVVVDAEDMKATETDRGEDISATPDEVISADTDVNEAWNPLWILLIGAIVVIAGLGIFFVTKKKETEK